MFRPSSLILLMAIALLWSSCSKRTHTDKATSTVAVTNLPVKKKKVSIPKVIVVNDKAASKSVDGRLYYDLDGHRYWRSKKDGKYYLFNKSMFDDPAFQP